MEDNKTSTDTTMNTTMNTSTNEAKQLSSAMTEAIEKCRVASRKRQAVYTLDDSRKYIVSDDGYAFKVGFNYEWLSGRIEASLHLHKIHPGLPEEQKERLLASGCSTWPTPLIPELEYIENYTVYLQEIGVSTLRPRWTDETGEFICAGSLFKIQPISQRDVGKPAVVYDLVTVVDDGNNIIQKWDDDNPMMTFNTSKEAHDWLRKVIKDEGKHYWKLDPVILVPLEFQKPDIDTTVAPTVRFYTECFLLDSIHDFALYASKT
jgi:hypothetical protein